MYNDFVIYISQSIYVLLISMFPKDISLFKKIVRSTVCIMGENPSLLYLYSAGTNKQTV